MKTEDFELLKAVCEKEGFEVDCRYPDSGPVFVKTKDPWDGVEFVDNGIKIRKIKSIEKGLVFYEGGSFNHINECKPSTEEAYIEQLKKEAFERFGEIKEGDRFDRTNIDYKWGSNVVMERIPFGNFFWKYDRSSDTLFIGRYGVYSKGKWAERVKERVSGEYVRYHILWPNEDCATLGFSFSGFANEEGLLPIEKLDDAGKFLASQLEKYLNEEL